MRERSSVRKGEGRRFVSLLFHVSMLCVRMCACVGQFLHCLSAPVSPVRPAPGHLFIVRGRLKSLVSPRDMDFHEIFSWVGSTCFCKL